MSSSGYEISDSTKKRLQILDFVAEKTGSKLVILWLLDHVSGQPELLTSYAIGEKKEWQELCETFVSLADLIDRDLNSALVTIEGRLGELLDQHGIKTDGLSFKPLWSVSTFFKHSIDRSMEGLVGYVAFYGSFEYFSHNESLQLLDIVAHQIDYGRAARFVEAVRHAKIALEGQSSSIDQKLLNLSYEVAQKLGATQCIYRNRNTTDDWTCSKRVDGDWVAERCDVNVPTSEIASAIERPVILSALDKEINPQNSGKMLIIPIYQSSFRLASMPFDGTQNALDAFERIDDCAIIVGFSHKEVPMYMQNRFSTTDVQIAQAVFGYTERSVQSEIFDENYSKVIGFLRENINRNEVTPQAILGLLRVLSKSFKNVCQIDIEGLNTASEMRTSYANREESLKDDYLERLKAGYLKKYFRQPPEERVSELRLGIDKSVDGYDIEIHLPSVTASSRLYVLRFTDETISESIVRSILHFFNELYVRIKKDENNDDRATYLMQVRHTFIHHMSAANTSIVAMYDRWQKGRRSELYWSALTKDSIIQNLMTKLHWSLRQAQLLLDNGRYAIGEIEVLDKKQFNIESIVEDCIKIFDDQRSLRDLHTFRKITGQKPSILNGDESLMTIALMNLFDNAYKYSTVGGRIGYRLDYGKDHYRFSITSAGECLDPEKKSLYFQLGTRGKQRDNLNPRHGSGLGLAITYKILKAHAKSCELDFFPTEYDSDYGGSTNTFFFEMPYRTGIGQDDGKSYT